MEDVLENPNDKKDQKIDNLIETNSKHLLKMVEKCERHDRLQLKSVEALIFLFFSISETYGRSGSVFLIQLANFVNDPTVLKRIKTFQPHGTNPKLTNAAPRYLHNFVVLRELLRKKKLLTDTESVKLGTMREERKKLSRFMIDHLEEENFLRGYVIMRYISKNDALMLRAFRAILTKVVDQKGNRVFSDAEIAPYFDQQKNGDKHDVADVIPNEVRDLRVELTSAPGLSLINKCCEQFENVWEAAHAKL